MKKSYKELKERLQMPNEQYSTYIKHLIKRKIKQIFVKVSLIVFVCLLIIIFEKQIVNITPELFILSVLTIFLLFLYIVPDFPMLMKELIDLKRGNYRIETGHLTKFGEIQRYAVTATGVINCKNNQKKHILFEVSHYLLESYLKGKSFDAFLFVCTDSSIFVIFDIYNTYDVYEKNQIILPKKEI